MRENVCDMKQQIAVCKRLKMTNGSCCALIPRQRRREPRHVDEREVIEGLMYIMSKG